MIGSLRGRVGNACCGPTIGASIVSPAGPQRKTADKSAPDDHLTPGPDCRMIVSALGRAGEVGRNPTIQSWIVPPARVQNRKTSPDDHLTPGPDCRKFLPASGRVCCAGRYPTVGARIVSPTGIQIAAIRSAPDDHFTASP